MMRLTGQQFGNYRLIKHLGKGGFGEVYLGQHIHIQREAAIKLLLNLSLDEIEQFRQEAQIIANLTHPRIVTIFDYDVEGDTPFIVMQYAEQGTLRRRYPHGVQVPLAEVAKYITQAAEGLQFAHDHQVIHRDIKPENMLLGPGGDLLLSDFGIAVMWSGTRSIGTQDASGTLAYMPAEQIMQHPRPASDQYALAITAYEWLSGARPMSESRMGLGIIQMQYPAVKASPLRQLIPQLPQKVDDVLQRALSSDWQERYPTIREFAQEFERAASSDARPFPSGYTTRPDIQATITDNPSLVPGLRPDPGAISVGTPDYATVAPPPPPPGPYQFQYGEQSYTPMPQWVMPMQQPPSNAAFVLGKILSIIGLIIGGSCSAFAVLGSLIAGQGWYANLWVGDIFFFFGVMIIFLTRIRRSPFPVPRARKIESYIGQYSGIAALVAGIIIIIYGAATLSSVPVNDGGIGGGVISIIEGVIIWFVARIGIKKTP